jgi:hypothetical protein
VAVCAWDATSKYSNAKEKRSFIGVVSFVVSGIAIFFLWGWLKPEPNEAKQQNSTVSVVSKKELSPDQPESSDKTKTTSANPVNRQSFVTRPSVPATQTLPTHQMSKKEAETILNGILEQYRKSHKGQEPTEAWVNEQLRKDGVPATATMMRPHIWGSGNVFSGGRGPGILLDSGSIADIDLDHSKIEDNGGPGIQTGTNVNLKLKLKDSEIQRNGTLPQDHPPEPPPQ